MPYNYYHRRFYKRKYPRRYRWPYRKRFRRTFRQRWRTRRNWVRKWRYSKRKRKLSKINIKQWQPRVIKNCTIKGNYCLFLCGKTRIPHNYILYKESMTPVGEASGGAWSILQLNLSCLYDLYSKYKNWWTAGNDGLPLVRYKYVKLKFYRSKFVDYIVTFNTCPPFSATLDMYLNTQPSRQLMNRKKIIVTQQKSNNKRNYKTIKLGPPKLLFNKWYMTQDICRYPLIVISTSAASLDQYYCPEDQISDNLTLYSLNTDIFQMPNFQTQDTKGYRPKITPKEMYLWGTGNGAVPPAKPKWEDLIYLGQTQLYTDGKTVTQIDQIKNKANWGNPFTLLHVHADTRVYYGYTWPDTTTSVTQTPEITEITEIYTQCRYNPHADKGTGNQIYWKSTYSDTTTFQTPPTDPDLILTDYPLWLGFWAWSDWTEKLHKISQLKEHYVMVVKTEYIKPKRNCYVFLDNYMTQINEKIKEGLTDFQKTHWYPRYDMQTEVEHFFAQSGPAAPKIDRSQCIQAVMNYSFHLKWGGCPAPMYDITDPCTQEKFPQPSKQLQRLQITHPDSKQQDTLFEWDQRRETITKKAEKRIKEYSSPKKSFTENPFDLQIQETSETSSESSEEEETPLEQQLLNLKRKQHQLRKQLYKLKKPKLY
nr:MAG: ORF1 [TTV-like mini virus]